MKILVDVDGVVADFVTAYLREVEAVTGHRYAPEDVKEWHIGQALGLTREQIDGADWSMSRGGWCSDLEPYTGAVEAVTELACSHDVWFCTIGFERSHTWDHDRRVWLLRHFPDMVTDAGCPRVIFTPDKRHQMADIMIDDNARFCKDWASEHWSETALLLDRPWNQGPHESEGVMRVRDWSEVLEAVESIEACG